MGEVLFMWCGAGVLEWRSGRGQKWWVAEYNSGGVMEYTGVVGWWNTWEWWCAGVQELQSTNVPSLNASCSDNNQCWLA